LHRMQTLKPLSHLANQHLVVHRAIAIYYSSSGILHFLKYSTEDK